MAKLIESTFKNVEYIGHGAHNRQAWKDETELPSFKLLDKTAPHW